MVNILFVCTGDTCRSTMASAMLKHKIKCANLTKHVRCSSAGLNVPQKQKISDNARFALNQLKIKVPNHLSTQLTISLLKRNTLVLTVTKEHKNLILKAYPQLTNVLSLTEYVTAEDIIDPYGKSKEVYLQTAKYLNYCVDKVFNKICKEFNLWKLQ